MGEGTERLRFSYPWLTFLQRGVHVAGGSDAPVEEPSPLIGMADAMDHVLHEHERLSFAQALDIYTTGAAYAGCTESRLGKLEPGYEADFVILSHKGAKLESTDLRKAEVEEGYVQGKVVKLVEVAKPSTSVQTPRDNAGKLGLCR